MNAVIAPRRGAGDDIPYAGDLGGRDAHDGRRDMGIPAARDVTTGGVNGDRSLAREYPRRQLLLEIGYRVTLLLGKPANPVQRPPDIVLHLLRQLRAGRVDHFLGNNDVTVIFIKRSSVFAGDLFTSGLNILQYFAGDLTGFFFTRLRRSCRFLQIFNHLPIQP